MQRYRDELMIYGGYSLDEARWKSWEELREEARLDAEFDESAEPYYPIMGNEEGTDDRYNKHTAD